MGVLKELWEESLDHPWWPDPINNPNYLNQLEVEKGIQAFLKDFRQDKDKIDQVVTEIVPKSFLNLKEMLRKLFAGGAIKFYTREGVEIRDVDQALIYFEIDLDQLVKETNNHSKLHGHVHGDDVITSRSILCFGVLCEMYKKGIIFPIKAEI